MADEMLFTMAGSVATPAQMVSLEEAGLGNRADLQEWLATNPEILGPAVKIVTFDLEGPGGSVPEEDRLSVLGLAQDGRLVVAELKWGRTSDVEVGAIKVAAQASRLLPESLAELYASFQSRHQSVVDGGGVGGSAGARPRSVHGVLATTPDRLVGTGLLPRPDVERRLAQRDGLDLRLVQIAAFRSYTGWQSGSGEAPMISVRQVYPLARRRGLHHQPRAGSWRARPKSPRSGCRTLRLSAGSCTPTRWRRARSSPSRRVATSVRNCEPNSRIGCTRIPSAAPPTGRTVSAPLGLGRR